MKARKAALRIRTISDRLVREPDRKLPPEQLNHDNEQLALFNKVLNQKKQLRRRSAIEPVIGHLKHDFRLSGNSIKGTRGDDSNVLPPAAAHNIKKWI